MGARKEVFISATSADLASYRQVAKEAVLTLGAHPIEEKNFPTDYRELQALLARRLDPCDAIIHLVGFYYGGESNAAGCSASVLDAMGILTVIIIVYRWSISILIFAI
jgi:hypothetical protein